MYTQKSTRTYGMTQYKETYILTKVWACVISYYTVTGNMFVSSLAHLFCFVRFTMSPQRGQPSAKS